MEEEGRGGGEEKMKNMIHCSISGCENHASWVSIQTLASPVCDDHLSFVGKVWRPYGGFVSIDKWLEMCPNGLHEPHVGCWGCGESKGLGLCTQALRKEKCVCP